MFRGQCENITGVQNFDAARYVGWWHEIESYPSDHAVGVCISSEFFATDDGFKVIETNVFGDSSVVNTSTVTVSSNGKLTKRDKDGNEVDIWVLATDYDSYALLYSCENVDDEYMRVWSAKHSKSRSLSAAANETMKPIIEANRVLDDRFYLKVDQSNEACFHYPVQTGPRIILDGQCDPDIPVQANFDVEAYTGTWYQIERYPQRFESGNCTGARYTLNDEGGVSVLNWQVVNGELSTISGNAVVTSTDGTARLRVTFPASQFDLWILTTDYTTYSLAYSCENLGPYRRAIGAWKLSRARTISPAANATIASFMEPRPELHQPYFLLTGQDADCLEPSSAILVKSSIIVMLVCAVLQLYL